MENINKLDKLGSKNNPIIVDDNKEYSCNFKPKVKKEMINESKVDVPKVDDPKVDDPKVDESLNLLINKLEDDAKKLFILKDYDGCIPLYGKLISLDNNNNNNYKHYTNRSLCYLKMQKFLKCVEDAKQSTINNKKWLKGYYLYAKGMIGLDNYMSAYTMLNDSLQYGSSKNIDELIDKCKEYIKLSPISFNSDLMKNKYNINESWFRDNDMIQKIYANMLKYCNTVSPKRTLRYFNDKQYVKFMENILKKYALNKNIIILNSIYGLFVLLAKSYGANNIYSFEYFSLLSKIAVNFIYVNRLKQWKLENPNITNKDDIEIEFNKVNSGIIVDTDINNMYKKHQQKCDLLLISEFDFTCLGTNIFETLSLYNEYNIIDKDTLIYPNKLILHAQLIQLDINTDKYRWCTIADEFDKTRKHKILSNEFVLYEFDLNNYRYHKEYNANLNKIKYDISIIDDGMVNAVIYWYDIIADDYLISTNSLKCIKPAIYYFDNIKVNNGSKLTTYVSFNNNKVLFDFYNSYKDVLIPHWEYESNYLLVNDLIEKHKNKFKDRKIMNINHNLINCLLNTKNVYIPACSNNQFRINSNNNATLNSIPYHMLTSETIPFDDINTLVIDDFDDMLVGTNVMTKLRMMKLLFTTDKYKKLDIYPKHGKVKAQFIKLIYNDDYDYDIKKIIRYRWTKRPESMKLYNNEHVKVGKPFTLFEFDFYNIPETKIEDVMEIDVEVGTINALAIWYELKMDDNEYIPINHISKYSSQNVQHLPEINILKNTKIKLNKVFDESFINIYFKEEELKENKDILPNFKNQCDVKWHNMQKELDDGMYCISKMIVENPKLFEKTSQDIIKIASNVGSFHLYQEVINRFIYMLSVN